MEEKNNARHQRLDIKPIDSTVLRQINRSTNDTLAIRLSRSFYGQRLTCEAENESNKLQHTIIIDLNRE